MFSQDWPEIRRMIQMVRRRFPTVPIVAGGEHITATADFTLRLHPRGERLRHRGRRGDHRRAGERAPRQGRRSRRSRAWSPGLPDGGLRPLHRPLARVSAPCWTTFPGRRGIGFLSRTIWTTAWATVWIVAAACRCSRRAVARTSAPSAPTPEMWTTRCYVCEPGQVLDEIQGGNMDKYGATNFDFYDLTAIVKRSWIIDFTNLDS